MTEEIRLNKVFVYFPVAGGAVRAVDGITASFKPGEYTAIVGESGCGKSVLGQAILGILPPYVEKSGEIIYLQHNLLEKLPEGFHGKLMGIIPQNPSESLNPIRSIRKQMEDILIAAGIAVQGDILENSLSYFGLEEPKRVLEAYPYELSGGMQQRVLCAMSLLRASQWILADEPTKGLDEATAQVVYENLAKFKAKTNCGMIVITHDIALAKKLCDRIAVMYAGQILEMGTEVLDKPRHPYTQAFIASLPENGFQPMEGKAPAPTEILTGCRFAPRCKYCKPQCRESCPEEFYVDEGMVRCYLYAKG